MTDEKLKAWFQTLIAAELSKHAECTKGHTCNHSDDAHHFLAEVAAQTGLFSNNAAEIMFSLMTDLAKVAAGVEGPDAPNPEAAADMVFNRLRSMFEIGVITGMAYRDEEMLQDLKL